LLFAPEEVLSLLIAFKLLIILLKWVYNLRLVPKQALIK
jgi:hypothetical protein